MLNTKATGSHRVVNTKLLRIAFRFVLLLFPYNAYALCMHCPAGAYVCGNPGHLDTCPTANEYKAWQQCLKDKGIIFNTEFQRLHKNAFETCAAERKIKLDGVSAKCREETGVTLEDIQPHHKPPAYFKCMYQYERSGGLPATGAERKARLDAISTQCREETGLTLEDLQPHHPPPAYLKCIVRYERSGELPTDNNACLKAKGVYSAQNIANVYELMDRRHNVAVQECSPIPHGSE